MTTRNSFTGRNSLKGALAAVALGIASMTATTMISTTAAQAAPGGHGPHWKKPGHGHGHGHHRPRPPRHWGPGYAAGLVPFSLGIVSYTVQPQCYVVKEKVHVRGVGRVWRPVTVCD
ncbi:hypothetical protein ACUSIJ_01875 [Pseudochelatococcus sp. B33]